MRGGVFVCHASRDAGVAQRVVAALEAGGVPCWIAPRDIDPGENYTQAILDGLESAPAIVLVFSSATNESPHVQRELETAVSGGRPIIPVRLEGVEPSRSLRYFIGTSQWLDTVGSPSELWEPPLVRAVRRAVGANAPAVSTTPPAGPPRVEAPSPAAPPPERTREPEPAPTRDTLEAGGPGAAARRQGLTPLALWGAVLGVLLVVAVIVIVVTRDDPDRGPDRPRRDLGGLPERSNEYDKFGYLDEETQVAGEEWLIGGALAGQQWTSVEDDPGEPQPYQGAAPYSSFPFSMSVEGV